MTKTRAAREPEEQRRSGLGADEARRAPGEPLTRPGAEARGTASREGDESTRRFS
ncbi:hypothetical protein ACFU8Q_01140 [Streptomyces sp. NPDC057543]|uniref:hypothetical protein n=1 Tax=Streptomyces sp. NPDC057543 TaxID=3346163 RepID=UPI0036D1AB7E